MGNKHSWNTTLSQPVIELGSHLETNTAGGVIDAEASSSGLGQAGKSMPGLGDADVQTLSQTSLKEMIQQETRFLQIVASDGFVGGRRYDIWITMCDNGRLKIEWQSITAVIAAKKCRYKIVTRDGNLRQRIPIDIGLDATEIKQISEFVVAEINAKLPPVKDVVSRVASWQITPPKIIPAGVVIRPPRVIKPVVKAQPVPRVIRPKRILTFK